MGEWLRSVAFTVYLFISVAVYGLLAFIMVPLGHKAVYAAARLWARFTLRLLKALCGLDYTVEGLENLPAQNTVILVKHSSAWEAIAQLSIFPVQCWVIKRELLWAPVLGWVLAFLKPIAIDRGAGRAAVQQVVDLGQKRLAEGLWVVIFPEGTRVAAGQTRRYGLSGALLAATAGRPVIPVAHNAGAFWPRRGLLKKPGLIRVVIGKPIATAGRDPRTINDDVRAWIEARVAAMPD